MNGYCISDRSCPYKSGTGYCGYITGTGCLFDDLGTVTISDVAPMQTIRVVDISEDSINAIADAVVERLRGEE